MSTTDAPEPDDRTLAVPTVRCDSCGSTVAESATDSVPRRYMSIVVTETWCLGCIKVKDETTERTLRSVKTDEPDY